MVCGKHGEEVSTGRRSKKRLSLYRLEYGLDHGRSYARSDERFLSVVDGGRSRNPQNRCNELSRQLPTRSTSWRLKSASRWSIVRPTAPWRPTIPMGGSF